MKITKVEYSKTFNLGNYQSAKIGFEVELEPHEQTEGGAGDALNALKQKTEREGDRLPRALR